MAVLLALAGQPDPALYNVRVRSLNTDLVVSCGNLDFDYLEFLVTLLNRPLLYVPGDDDPDLRTDWERGLVAVPHPGAVPRIDALVEPPGPRGCTTTDGLIHRVKDLTVAGLGGVATPVPRAPQERTESAMRLRTWKLRRRAARRRLVTRRAIDVLALAAPPVGDGASPSLHRLVEVLRPALVIHAGDPEQGDTEMAGSLIAPISGSRLFDVSPGRVVQSLELDIS